MTRLQDRLALAFQKAASSWHAVRDGRGRGLTLKRDSGLLRLHDGVRQLFIPHVGRAALFRDGINAQLEKTALKYVGGTGYVPREGDVVVDIGAGVGEFTLWCADAGARVLAFEPDPLAFDCLQRNIAGLENVQAYGQALWKEPDRLRLHGSPDTTESSLIEEGASKARIVEVEASTLDSLPSVVALPVIDFLKIDGEGVEPEILVGGIRTLRRTRVVAIDVEASGRRPNLETRIDTILEAMNFRPLAREGNGAVLALNTAMVGPFSNRVGGRRDS